MYNRIASFGAGLLGCCLLLGIEPALARDEIPSGAVVEFAGLKNAVPKDWNEDAIRELNCYKRFQLDVVGSIKYNAHVTLFRLDRKELPTAADAVMMWQKKFAPPPGKMIQEPSSVKKIKIAGLEFTQVDIIGTFKGFSDEPMTAYLDFRLIGAYVDTPKGVYLAQLIGPTETVEFYRKDFEAWLNGLRKAD
jgi:hypothetical protein